MRHRPNAWPLILIGLAAPATAAPGVRSYPLAGFDRVSLAGPDDVVVRVGPRAGVRASGDPRLLDHLVVRVVRGELKIERERGWRQTFPGKALVSVTLPALAAASIAGSGDMRVDRAGGANFAGSVAGSGDLSIDMIAARAATLSVSGSGDLRTAGRAGTLTISLAGSGDVATEGLVADRVDVTAAGSGSVRVAARTQATVAMVGSGSVAIGGKPRCSVTRIGTGEVTCG